MASNKTGTPNTQSYTLGRGILYFCPIEAWDANGRPTAWRDVGNSPEFNISVAVEDLDHTQRRTGLATIDKSVVLSQNVGLSFQLDELSSQNLAMLFSGADETHSQATVRDGFSQVDQPYDLNDALGSNTSVVDCVTGRWYDMHDANGDRVMAIKNSVTIGLRIKGDFGSPVALVVNEDYILDREMGRFFIPTTSTRVTYARVSAGECLLDLTVSATASAEDVSEVRAISKTSIVGALKFIADNPTNDGEKTEYQFHRVSLRANGDLSLVGDDWTTMSMEGTAERYATADPDAPVMRVRSLGLAGPAITLVEIASGSSIVAIYFDCLVTPNYDAFEADAIHFDYLEEVYSWTGSVESIAGIIGGVTPGTSIVVLPLSAFDPASTSTGERITVAANLFKRVGARAEDPGNQPVTDFPVTVI